jgi:hypothetical protein
VSIPGNPVIPMPTGYSVYRDLSYDITTTAATTGLITLSFDLNSLLIPGNPVTPQIFSRLRVFHGENGVFVDRTVPGNPVIPGNPVLVGTVGSLSPFVIGLLNDAPTLDPIAAQTVMQGNTFSLTAVGYDVDEEQPCRRDQRRNHRHRDWLIHLDARNRAARGVYFHSRCQ